VQALRPNRVLKRSNAQRWRRVAEVSRLTAKSAARQFLENVNTVRRAVGCVWVGVCGDTRGCVCVWGPLVAGGAAATQTHAAAAARGHPRHARTPRTR
jgi:hypothetical protein